MESPAKLQFLVANLQRVPLDAVTLKIGPEGLATQMCDLAGVAPGASISFEYPLDTSLRPDTYEVVVDLDAKATEPFRSRETFFVRIVPRPLPLRFPVLMWGVSGGLGEETSRLKRIGFTHVLGWGADYDRIWQAGAPTEAATPPVVAQTRRALDDALANDLTVVASLSPGSWLRTMENFRRVNRQGKTYQQEDICGPHLRPGGLQLVFGRGSMWLSQMDQPGAGGLRRRATLFFMVGLMGFVSA